jgi:hypothetical protein
LLAPEKKPQAQKKKEQTMKSLRQTNKQKGSVCSISKIFSAYMGKKFSTEKNN